MPRAAGRRVRPADRLAAHRRRHRSRRGLPPRPVAGADRPDAVRRLRPAAGRDDLHLDTSQYKVILEVQPKFQNDPSALSHIYVAPATGAAGAAAAVAHFTDTVQPLTVNHQGQFPAVTLSFNLAPGVALGQAVDAIQAMQAELHVPATLHGTFQGTAQAFQASLSSTPLLVARRDPRRLYRAGHALRELHPPDHHPVGAALGRRRRAADADAVRLRSERDRADRHHPADRHRQEERHHDDRLRAGGRARRRARARWRRSTRPACCASARS